MTNEKLFKAVETNNATEVKKALAEEKINPATHYGAKSIIFASKQENREILKMLLQNGEKISRESFWRRTALLALSNAIQAENIETLQLLLEYGAGADKKILNSPTLLSAVNEQNTEMIALLTEHGMDMNKKLPTPTAIQKKQKFVFENGVFIPIKGSLEYKFLKAIREEDYKKAKFWLEKIIEDVVGVLTDETGKSTLEIARENHFEDVVKILANFGIYDNFVDNVYRQLMN